MSERSDKADDTGDQPATERPAIISRDGVDKNLRFLILEVQKQLRKTQTYLHDPTEKLSDSVQSRDDYIDNLKSIIQRKCFKLATEASIEGKKRDAELQLLRAIEVVTVNLERIADFCTKIIDQLRFITVRELLHGRHFDSMFDLVADGIADIETALFNQDVKIGLSICRKEATIDHVYERDFRTIIGELEKGSDAGTLVTVIFIAHYLERMGDSLLNIGEAIISAGLGERIKIEQFLALEDSLAHGDMPHSVEDISLEAAGETRSGCRIDRVSSRRDGGRLVIFKEGRSRKLKEEKESIDRWHNLMPGLAPRIHSFQEHGEFGALLFEYLPGRTFEELLLQEDTALLNRALGRVTAMVTRVWEKTREPAPVNADFLGQLESRLKDVYAVHPSFQSGGGRIGGVNVDPFDQLVDKVEPINRQLTAPFSVFIHGDFNVDNLIYDPDADTVRLIDLHRSRMFDYVQDVSVFLVSNHRLQVFSAPIRRRINNVILSFYDFAHGYAQSVGDETFDARLALGLARSFATSTRFVLDPKFAQRMFLRARYLLEQLIGWDPEDLGSFRIYRDAMVD